MIRQFTAIIFCDTSAWSRILPYSTPTYYKLTKFLSFSIRVQWTSFQVQPNKRGFLIQVSIGLPRKDKRIHDRINSFLHIYERKEHKSFFAQNKMFIVVSNKVSPHTVIWMEFLNYAISLEGKKMFSHQIIRLFCALWHSINLSIGLCLEIHKQFDECLCVGCKHNSRNYWLGIIAHFILYFTFQTIFNGKASRKQLNCVLLKFIANLVSLLAVRLIVRRRENRKIDRSKASKDDN